MGEIGIGREDFLYRMAFWEIRLVVRGYRERQKNIWEATRWQTFWLMHVGMADTSRVDFESLLRLPWDRQGSTSEPSQEDIDRLREKLRAYNKSISSSISR